MELVTADLYLCARVMHDCLCVAWLWGAGWAKLQITLWLWARTLALTHSTK